MERRGQLGARHPRHDLVGQHKAEAPGIGAHSRQRPRGEAGQTPILTARIEKVGWRTDLHASENLVLPTPRVAARRVHADRKIADQPDTHTGRNGAALRSALRRRDVPTVIEVPVGAMPSPWEFIFMDKIRGK